MEGGQSQSCGDIVRHLNEISVRISEVDGQNRPLCSCSGDWALFNGDIKSLKALHHLLQGRLCDQTNVQGAWNGVGCFGIKFLSHLVQVKFLVSETQCFPVPLESSDLHAQDLGIEHGGVFNVLYGHHNVVKSTDKTRGRGLAAGPP